MSIYINCKYGVEKARQLKQLVLLGKKGDLITLNPGYGYMGTIFGCIKMKSNTVNIYTINRYRFSKPEYQTAVIKVTKEYITFISNDYQYSIYDKKFGDWFLTCRAFLSMGIIPNVSLEYLRNGTLITDKNKVEIGSYFPIKMSWDGEIISRIPKAAKTFAEKCHKDDRAIKNRNARANYANTRILRLMKEAKENNNWDKINTEDVFALTNVARRTELIQYFGTETILKDMNAKTVDTDEIDGRKYELLRFVFPTSRKGETIPATYLKMINPSTAEVCIEGVPNNRIHEWNTAEITMNTVKQALIWRDNDLTHEYIKPTVMT